MVRFTMLKLLTPHEVCKELGVCRRTLRRYEEAGLIAPVKLNQRKFLYLREDIEAMLQKFKAGRAA
jgi:predicted site-specific integrase-resolvase